MARPRIIDLLQNYPFWLLDVQPSARPPFLVLGGPIYGFSAISHPEISINIDNVEQMNRDFPVPTYAGADSSTMTLQRGQRFYDSSFYSWIRRFIDGEDTIHRDLMLIQHMGLAAPGDLPGLTPDFIEIVRVPGKAWMLWDCHPTRYTPGQGLDATSGDVTVQELDIKPTEVEEFSLDPFLIADQTGF